SRSNTISRGGVATSSGSGPRSPSKRDRSWRSKMATSPPSTRVRPGSAATAARDQENGVYGPRGCGSPAGRSGRPYRQASAIVDLLLVDPAFAVERLLDLGRDHRRVLRHLTASDSAQTQGRAGLS